MVLPVDLSISLVVHELLHCHQMGRVQGSPGAELSTVEVRKTGKAVEAFPGLWLHKEVS